MYDSIRHHLGCFTVALTHQLMGGALVDLFEAPQELCHRSAILSIDLNRELALPVSFWYVVPGSTCSSALSALQKNPCQYVCTKQPHQKMIDK